MDKQKKIIVAAMTLAAAFVLLKKPLWKWLSSEPPTVYVPDSIAAELFIPDIACPW